MEELDLKELFNIFWSKKLQMILIISIFIVIGIIYTVGFTTPMYSASTTLVLAASSKDKGQATESDTITTNDLTINSKLVSTYSELVKSKNVLRQVIDNLGINISETSLRENVSVASVKNTELIEITVTTLVAQDSAKIANEVAKVFTEKVKEIYNIQNVQIVDEAEVNNIPSNINHKKDVMTFALIGVVVALIYTIIINMLDTTVKTAEEIEAQFKLPVLASIPLYEGESNKSKRKRGRR